MPRSELRVASTCTYSPGPGEKLDSPFHHQSSVWRYPPFEQMGADVFVLWKSSISFLVPVGT